MHISHDNAPKKSIGPMHITEYKLSPQYSGALIEIDGNHGKVKCLKEDRMYYIADGAGEFQIKDDIYAVKKDDVLFVPMNTPYNFMGKMKIFMICSPEFNAEDDVYLD